MKNPFLMFYNYCKNTQFGIDCRKGLFKEKYITIIFFICAFGMSEFWKLTDKITIITTDYLGIEFFSRYGILTRIFFHLIGLIIYLIAFSYIYAVFKNNKAKIKQKIIDTVGWKLKS